MPVSPDDASDPHAATRSSSATAARDAPPALPALRDAAGRAAAQLRRLRERVAHLEDENERLRERVAALEADPAAGRDGVALLLDEDPDALRERLDRFIDTLDEQLG